jgi:uncharacterized protein YjbI with pentapeptide repeats/nucleoside phosphorylase
MCYSKRDRVWLQRVLTHLKPYVAGKSILWADPGLRAGDRWQEEIDEALSRTKVAVLLVSADFMASDFIQTQELPKLIQAADHQLVSIIWILLSDCAYSRTALPRYHAAHDVTKPLKSLSGAKRDAVLASICQQIDAAFRSGSSDSQGRVGVRVIVLAADPSTHASLRRGIVVERPNDLTDALKVVFGRLRKFHVPCAASAPVEACILADHSHLRKVVADYQPDLLIVLGAAAGFPRRVKVGDVVVASELQFFDFDGRAFSTRLRSTFHMANKRLLKIVHLESARPDWHEWRTGELPTDVPRVVISPVVNVNCAILQDHTELKWASREKFPNAAAIEFDGHACTWLQEGLGVPGLDIVGVSSLLMESESRGEDTSSSEVARDASVAFTLRLLEAISGLPLEPSSQDRVTIRLTLDTEERNAGHLLSLLTQIVNDPHLRIVEMTKGSMILGIQLQTASAALTTALWGAGLLKEMLGIPVKEVSGAPESSGSFLFDQLLDSIQLLGDQREVVQGEAIRRIKRQSNRLPGWTLPLDRIVHAHYACSQGWSTRKRITQEELNDAVAEHRSWLRSLRKKPDKRRAHFYHADLSGLDLAGADLRHAIIRWSTLRAAKADGVDLRHADLEGCDLTDASLTHAQLTSSELGHCHMQRANLAHANLRRADLRGADLSGADVSSCDMKYALLRKSTLLNTNFSFSDLSKANLRHSDVTGADFSGTKLRGTNLIGIDLWRAASVSTREVARARTLPTPVAFARLYKAAVVCLDALGAVVVGAFFGGAGALCVWVVLHVLSVTLKWINIADETVGFYSNATAIICASLVIMIFAPIIIHDDLERASWDIKQWDDRGS